jgi:hypothetical protein
MHAAREVFEIREETVLSMIPSFFLPKTSTENKEAKGKTGDSQLSEGGGWSTYSSSSYI